MTVPAAPPERKPPCRVRTKFTDDHCHSEAVTDFGMCAHHLAGAAEEYRRIIEEHGGDGR